MSESDNDSLDRIAEDIGEVELSDGMLDDSSSYEKGEAFGYE